MSLQPATVEELQSIVKSHNALLPCAGGTKPALSTPQNGAMRVDMSQISGIIEYEPNEYTFTAYAGTPVQEVAQALAEHGQYLPFDPLLVAQGATLGGVVAANTAGSGRFRFGGVRDFILGLHFVDGHGQLVLGGGKVVKNAAGFDLPKFMVGSLGRFGIFVDLSFKVFPQPRAYVTLKVSYPNLEEALQAVYSLAVTPLEMDALDLEPAGSDRFALVIRLGGLPAALPGRTGRLQNFLKSNTQAGAAEVLEDNAEAALWAQANALGWAAGEQHLIKVPLAPKRVPEFDASIQEHVAARRYSVGGNVAWLSAPNLEPLNDTLIRLELAGLVLFGPPGRPFIGARKGEALARRVKKALDPSGKFLDL